MHPIESFKNLLPLVLILLSIGLGFVLIKWPRGNLFTFSQHVAAQKISIIYYRILFTLVLPLLLLFFICWFVPTYRLSIWFTVSIVISSIMQYIATLIPEVGGWKTKYHRVLAGLSAILLLPLLIFILMSDSIHQTSKIITLLSMSTMITIIGLLIKGKGRHKYILFLQTGYFLAFFVAICATTYFG